MPDTPSRMQVVVNQVLYERPLWRKCFAEFFGNLSSSNCLLHARINFSRLQSSLTATQRSNSRTKRISAE
eukprot:4937985-Amphidinium_carterae.2